MESEHQKFSRFVGELGLEGVPFGEITRDLLRQKAKKFRIDNHPDKFSSDPDLQRLKTQEFQRFQEALDNLLEVMGPTDDNLQILDDLFHEGRDEVQFKMSVGAEELLSAISFLLGEIQAHPRWEVKLSTTNGFRAAVGLYDGRIAGPYSAWKSSRVSSIVDAGGSLSLLKILMDLPRGSICYLRWGPGTIRSYRLWIVWQEGTRYHSQAWYPF